jgi:chemotaxis protein CheZ
VQRKVFRIEQTMTGKRPASPFASATEHRRMRDEIDAMRAQLVSQTQEPSAAHTQSLADELTQIRDTIAQHKRDLSSLIDDGRDRRMARAADELGAAVDGMETATQKILRSAEIIDDGARALTASLQDEFKRGVAQDIQDHVVNIFEACNFQDLAGQRIGKVIATLGAIEDQVTAMMARGNGQVAPMAATPAHADNLVNGPKLDGDAGHASQYDIDQIFGLP